MSEETTTATATAPDAADAAPAAVRRPGRRPRTDRAVRRPRPQREAGPWRLDGATTIAAGMLLVFTAVVGFGAYLFVGSGLAEHRQQSVMYAQMKHDLALATVPVGAPIAAGTPLGIVSAPAIGLDQVFVMGSSSQQTLDGPGLKSDSVLPGQQGYSVLVGRRTTGGAPFRYLDKLSPGDRIQVTTGQGVWTYVVDVVRRSTDPATRIATVPSRLTLVTSDPAITNTRTLQVSARLQGTAVPASTGAAAGTTAVAADVPGQGLHDHTIALLLWAQLLLVTVVAATWAAVRLPGKAVWLGAVPVVLAVGWQVAANLTLLLPNTL